MAAPGGNALYASVGANIWSSQVGITAVVGYDWPSEYTRTLHQSAIDTSGLTQTDEETLRAWTIYEASGYRRYLSRNTEVVLLTPSPYSSQPLTAIEAAAYSQASRTVHMRNSPLPHDVPEADTVHLCPMRLETVLSWIDYLQAKPDIFVSIDMLPYPVNGNLDDPRLLKVLNRTDAFLPSEAEAESLMPGHQVDQFCRRVAARGPKIVAIKQGDHGVTVYDRERDHLQQLSPYPADVADLTGAGDSFCGGFAVGWFETGDPIQAAHYGMASASFIIESFGGLQALSTARNQAQTRLAELYQLNQLQVKV
jgi:ribokinase